LILVVIVVNILFLTSPIYYDHSALERDLTTEAVDSESTSLKILTFNAWHGLVTDEGILKLGEYETSDRREVRYSQLLEELQRLDPDVIALQEANPLPEYATKIASDLGFDEIHQIANGGVKLFGWGIPLNVSEGLILLAREELNLELVGKIRLSGPWFSIQNTQVSFQLSETRYALIGKIRVEGKEIYILNTHLHAGFPFGDTYIDDLSELRNAGEITDSEYDFFDNRAKEASQRREEELFLAISWIRNETDNEHPIILLGDFNSIENSNEIRTILDYHFIDAFREKNPGLSGFTSDSILNPKVRLMEENSLESQGQTDRFESKYLEIASRIDYIFLSSHFQSKNILESFVTLNRSNEDGVYPSDHFAVFAEILLP
tara:strand:- start:2423 stop:3553 length:1131 start_codon:yes stop_codon:yes gene_type:complete